MESEEMEASCSSDSDSVELMTPLTTDFWFSLGHKLSYDSDYDSDSDSLTIENQLKTTLFYQFQTASQLSSWSIVSLS